MRLTPRAYRGAARRHARGGAQAGTRTFGVVRTDQSTDQQSIDQQSTDPLSAERPATDGAHDDTYGPALPDDATVHLVLDLALRIGEVQMASGAGASDVTATIFAVTGAYGLAHCEVDVVLTSITVCCHRGNERPPVTALRVVRGRGLDYTRLSSVEELITKIARGRIELSKATGELGTITSAGHPYPRWTATVAYAALAASVAVLLGGDGLVASIAAVITATIDRVGRWLNRRGLPVFFQQVVGGALATGMALAIVHSGAFGNQLQPSLVVAAAITVLLSGLAVVSTVQDAITGYNVTAAGRSVEVALQSAGLIAGVTLALNVAVGIGQPATPIEYIYTTPLHLPIQVIAGATAAGFFALASYATVRAVLVAAIAGAIGALCYGVLTLLHLGPILSAAIAAGVLGFGGGVLARRIGIPPLIVAVSGLVPLLPGLPTYRALYELAVVRSTLGIPSLMIAGAVALALGAGVVLGEFLAQPVRTGLGRLERRLTGPRLAGPLRVSRRRLD